MTFTLGTFTFGGTILQETPTEITVLMVGDWCTVRIPKAVTP